MTSMRLFLNFLLGVFSRFNLRDIVVMIVGLFLSAILPYFSRFDPLSSFEMKSFTLAARLANGFAYSCTNEFTNTLMQRMNTYICTLKTNYNAVINRSTDQEISRIEHTGNGAVQKVVTLVFKFTSSVSLLLAVWKIHGIAVTGVVAIVSALFMYASIEAVRRISLKLDRTVSKGQKVMRGEIGMDIEQDYDAPVLRNYRINERVYIAVISTMLYAIVIAAIIGINDLIQLYTIVDTFKAICSTAANDVFGDLSKFWATMTDMMESALPDGSEHVDKVYGVMFKNVSYKHRAPKGVNMKTKPGAKAEADENAINGLNLELKTGINIFLGNNGVGKSSLIATLFSTLSSGNLLFNLKSKIKIAGNRVKESYRAVDAASLSLKSRFHLVACVDQGSENQVEFTPNMITELSDLAKKLIATDPSDPIAALAKALGIDALKNNLSGGQKIALIVWRILKFSRSSVICLDESFGELDEKKKVALLKYLQDYCSDKVVIVVAHGIPAHILSQIKHTSYSLEKVDGRTVARC